MTEIQKKNRQKAKKDRKKTIFHTLTTPTQIKVQIIYDNLQSAMDKNCRDQSNHNKPGRGHGFESENTTLPRATLGTGRGWNCPATKQKHNCNTSALVVSSFYLQQVKSNSKKNKFVLLISRENESIRNDTKNSSSPDPNVFLQTRHWSCCNTNIVRRPDEWK